MPYDQWEHKHPGFLGEGEWHVIDPTGGIGAYCRSTTEKPVPAHTAVIHEDGTVSFSPSLIQPSGWHGFLKRGVFT